MYKIAICDDDKDYIKELKDIILESNEKRLAIEFYDFDCGEKLLHSKIDDMDVIFLDIQMGGTRLVSSASTAPESPHF